MVFNTHDILMGLGGGLLIGSGAAMFLLFVGRIAGISGIASAVARIEPGEQYKGSVCFLVGLIAAPQIYGLFQPMPAIGITHSLVLLSVGGLLVGFGSRTGGGCTSGHGVCGLSRFSPRSITATLVFMSIAIAVAVFVRPMIYG